MARVRIWKWVLAWAIVAAVGPGSVSAQIAFERTYGGPATDWARSVQQIEDGGYIIAGTTASFGAGGEDFYLIRTDAWGEVVWARTYGGPDYDRANSVQQTLDGGYIITGETASFGGPRMYDIYLVKTDALGDTMRTRVYGSPDGGEEGQSVQQTLDGGYIVTGNFDYIHGGAVWLLKTDPSGDTLWTRTYRPPYSSACGHSVRQTQDGGYIIAGYMYDRWSNFDIYLIKTDPWGDTLWTRTYGDTTCEVANSVQQTLDGGYIITGETRSFGGGHLTYDIYLVKTDAGGDSLWMRTYGDSGADYGRSVEQTQDGGYIIAGTWTPGDVCLIKTDRSGDTLWTRTYGGTAEDCGWSVQQTRDGGYIIAGSTRSFGAGGRDVYLIKTGPPLQSDLVTGGGWIPGRSRRSGGKGTFGFNAHSEGTKVWGQLQFSGHATKMKVHSDTVRTLVIQPGDTVASFSGDCLVDHASGYSFHCEVMDRGEPGHYVDWFSINVYDGDWNLYYSAGGVLGGGNIQIHRGDDGIAKGESDPGVEPGDDPNPPPSTQGEAFVPLAGKGLLQNSPNPFCRATTIRYSVASAVGGQPSAVNLSIYDLAGRLVRTLVNGTQTAGQYAVDWDGKDSSGRKVATGIYIYQLTARDTEGPPETRRTSRQADDFSRTEKMVILR